MLQLFCTTTPLLPLLQWNCSNIESRECEFCFYLSIECVFYIVSPMTHRLSKESLLTSILPQKMSICVSQIIQTCSQWSKVLKLISTKFKKPRKAKKSFWFTERGQAFTASFFISYRNSWWAKNSVSEQNKSHFFGFNYREYPLNCCNVVLTLASPSVKSFP